MDTAKIIEDPDIVTHGVAIDYDLPFKIHTGYYAGHSRMPTDYIPAGHLSPLLAKVQGLTSPCTLIVRSALCLSARRRC
jgi:hypothetical protein